MNATIEKRKALGRGLDSLLPGGPRVVGGTAAQPAAADSAPADGTANEHGTEPGPVAATVPELYGVAAPRIPAEGIREIAIDQIDLNPYQTRVDFDRLDMEELTDSIRSMGVLQPIVVRPTKEGRYSLIMGERRLQASEKAGKTTIPAVVRKVSEQQAAEMTLVENLMRQDLNCYEQAHAFARLSQEFGMTQEQIGQRTGCSRETVSNYMRILRLPGRVQLLMREGRIDFSRARVLLNLLDLSLAEKVAEKAVNRELSVAQLEDLVFETNVPLERQPGEQKGRARWVDPNVRAAQTELERLLGVRVKIRDRRGKGKIVIEYSTLEDFDRVLGMMKGKKEG